MNIFLPPVRRHRAKILCLRRAPISPVRWLRSHRERMLTTRRTPPLWRSHRTLIVWRWTDFCSQNLQAWWGNETNLMRRSIQLFWRNQNSLTELIRSKKSDVIIIKFFNPNFNINRQNLPQIFCQPIISLRITICKGQSNRTDFWSEHFRWTLY